MKSNLGIIKKEWEIFGLLFLVYSATISRCQFLNILSSGGNIQFSVLETVYCQGRLADNNKKYVTFICNKFLKHMKEIDPAKQYHV